MLIKSFPLDGRSSQGFSVVNPDFRDATNFARDLAQRTGQRCFVLKSINNVADPRILAEFPLPNCSAGKDKN
jgi:hypothetical protein